MSATRRHFLAAATAASYSRILGANDRVQVGFVGYGLMRQSRRPMPGPQPLPVEWDLVPRPVFTADERRVYRLLREALPHHVVLAKLPLVRFCQPSDPQRMRYWYELLGAIHVSFAICSANGRVLAAIDLSYDQGGPPGRAPKGASTPSPTAP